MKLVQSFSDFLSMNAATLGLTRQEYTSRYLSEAFENINDLIKALHFEIDPKAAEEMKIELGKRQGEVTRRKQIEGGEYSLRRFRKEIKYDETGEDLGVFKPGSYMAATSTLGDGKHTKAVKKVKWNQRKYDKWVKELAYDNDGGGQDSSYGFEMAQNAKFEPGLIDYIKRTNRGEDPLQRIQWDIEAAMESVSNPSLKFIKPLSLFEAKLSKIHNAAKKGSYPVSLVVIENGKVIKQELVGTPQIVPAAFNQLKKEYPNAVVHVEDRTGKRLFSESIVTEEKIKYAKGKTYQSSGHWTVYVDSNSSGFDIRVNHSAGWRLDPHDEREETLELLDNGRQKATIYFKSGNIDKFAQKMFDLNDRTTNGNQTKLTAKDYADIIRVWIDMKKANESVVTEAKDMTFTDYLKVLDTKFEDAMAAVKGENGSDAEITPTRGDILQNFTLFRNYVSSLTKKYKGDKTKLRFLTEKVREYELVINESPVNESDKTPTMLLAAEIEGAEFHMAFGDGTVVDARATKKTWDDGVPVLKYIARAPKKSVTIPKGKFEVVIDDKYGWIYWQDKGVWYGMDKDDDYIPFEF
jgi:hypothetical protein